MEQLLAMMRGMNLQAAPEDESAPQLTRDDIVAGLREGKFKKVVFMAGAGLSVAAGIPDFRSPGTGLYANLAKYNLPRPEAVFELSYFKKDPQAFYTLSKELFPQKKYHPTLGHFFMVLLKKKGLLQAVYTQNVDCLEYEAGLGDDDVCCAHGSFRTARVLETGEPVDIEIVREAVSKGEICYKDGKLVKPDIVFFGESMPKRFFQYPKDFNSADLLIVMGTALAVMPFASLVECCDVKVPRVLLNREAVGPFCEPRKSDVSVLGDLDTEVLKLCTDLGWKDELLALRDAYMASLTTPAEVTPASAVIEAVANAPATQPAAAVPPTRDLTSAIRTGNVNKVRQLISKGVDINARCPGGIAGQVMNGKVQTGKQIDLSMLDLAVDAQELEILDVLLEAGARPDNTDAEGGTPLQLAAQNGNADAVAALLRHGANPNAADALGGTALIRAAEAGSVASVKALLAAGANVNGRGASVGGTPLYWATMGGHVEVVRVLLDAGANAEIRDNNGSSPRDIAAVLGFTEVANLLSNTSAASSTSSSTSQPASSGVTMDVQSALKLAIMNNDTAALEVLLAEGDVDVNVRLPGACRAETKGVNGQTDSDLGLLELAIDERNPKILQFLLERHADPNRGDVKGSTPLMLAAQYGFAEGVKLLLAHHANPNAAEHAPLGGTALIRAAEAGATDCVELLLAAGAAPNTRGQSVGGTALYWATMGNHEEAAKALLKAGADPSIQDNKGLSILQLAENLGLSNLRSLYFEAAANAI